MRIIRIGNEVYVEFTTTKSALLAVAKLVGGVVLGLASFYALWILTEFLK